MYFCKQYGLYLKFFAIYLFRVHAVCFNVFENILYAGTKRGMCKLLSIQGFVTKPGYRAAAYIVSRAMRSLVVQGDI